MQIHRIPYKRTLIPLARQNRKKSTKAERRMWSMLRGKKIRNLKFTRQKPLDSFIADFYCSALLLVIEVDGSSHIGKNGYDTFRSDILKTRHKITIIRYTNNEVLHNTQDVYTDLLQKIDQMILTNPPRRRPRPRPLPKGTTGVGATGVPDLDP